MTKIEDVYVADHALAGKGVFAARDFEVDEVILRITGEMVETTDPSQFSPFVQDHCFPFDKNKYVLPSEPWMYLNHSCEPNAGIKDNLNIVAMLPIQRGQEVTFDYAMNNNDDWTMECHCGTPCCRGRVGRFSLLDRETRERYRGYVCDFIADEFF